METCIDMADDDDNTSKNIKLNTNEITEDYDNINIEVTEFDKNLAHIDDISEVDEKLISYIEREVRGSYEYRKYIKYLKTDLNLTKCALMDNIDTNIDAVSLEFHHYPINLYEITDTVAKKMVDNLAEGDSLSCFEIASQVVKEHYEGNVGLVPLTVSLHEMAHNRAIIIPTDKINGNYKHFVAKYSNFIEDPIIERIQDVELQNDTQEAKNFNASKLEKKIKKFNITYNKRDDI